MFGTFFIKWKCGKYQISSVPFAEQTVCERQLPSCFIAIKLFQGRDSHIIEYISYHRELVQPIILITITCPINHLDNATTVFSSEFFFLCIKKIHSQTNFYSFQNKFWFRNQF
ncbi:hypothetical protein V8G54_034314 [Vigna mungo]|uniref:Uncharacterized protein n=1 Tax=Vigna mungo TaxID=3915 RepID=A0AAQ3MQJ1_VIGMU